MGLVFSRAGRMSTIGLMETKDSELFPWTSRIPFEWNPGRIHGANAAIPRDRKATRRAVREVDADPRPNLDLPCHTVTGPQWPTRLKLSANSRASAARRNGIV